jgi:hypothetical protein
MRSRPSQTPAPKPRNVWQGGTVTTIAFDVPVIEAFPVSVAVMVCGPPVFSVAEKVPVPLVNVEFAGKIAAPSLLVK